jgi:hypothetical protein
MFLSKEIGTASWSCANEAEGLMMRELYEEIGLWLLCGSGVVLATWQYYAMVSSYTD